MFTVCILLQPLETGITVSDMDNDINDLPLGLNSTWTTTAAGTGIMKITLRHYANGGKEMSDPVSSSKSATDAEVEFRVMCKCALKYIIF